MILSRQDYRNYLAEDLRANGLSKWRPWDRWRHPVMHFQRRLRETEYVLNCRRGRSFIVYRIFARWRLRAHGIRLGFTIPPNVFGPGLSIAHWGTIVVNENCRVGAHCRIHPGTCLGWNKGGVPLLGNDCYIGPGAKLYGGIALGDNTRVGANAVVNRSWPESGLTLTGIPARPLESGAGTEDGMNCPENPDLVPARAFFLTV